MKITAVIPIRKGSQRVKDKNTRPFAGTTLLENKISTLLNVPEIDEIVVNTNSEIAVQIVKTKFSGTKVRMQPRDEYFASSACSGSEFFKHLGDVTDTDIFIYAPCTSPFVKVDTISTCIRKFLCAKGLGTYDCVSTVSPVKEFLWLGGKAINYDPENAPNSQDLPDVVALNFGVTVVDRETIINNRNIIGKHPLFVTVTDIEGIDIDTPLDFYLAEQIFQRTIIEHGDLLSE